MEHLHLMIDRELKAEIAEMAKARFTRISELTRQALVNELNAWKRSQLKETH